MPRSPHLNSTYIVATRGNDVVGNSIKERIGATRANARQRSVVTPVVNSEVARVPGSGRSTECHT